MKKGTLIAIGCTIVAVFIAVVVLVIYGIYQSGILGTVTNRISKTMGVERASSVVFGYPSGADTETILDVLRRRADSMGITEADFEVGEDCTIIMRATNLSEGDFEGIADTFTASGHVEFCDSNGDVVLSGEDIEHAAYRFGSVSSAEAPAEHYVEIVFTQQGTQKFSEATGRAAAMAPVGGNYITIEVDGEVISAPSVNEQITTDTVVVSGDFTQETATELANLINAGALPCELEVLEIRGAK